MITKLNGVFTTYSERYEIFWCVKLSQTFIYPRNVDDVIFMLLKNLFQISGSNKITGSFNDKSFITIFLSKVSPYFIIIKKSEEHFLFSFPATKTFSFSFRYVGCACIVSYPRPIKLKLIVPHQLLIVQDIFES